MNPVGINGRNGDGTGRELAGQVALARQTLEEARSRLDLAVAALPDIDGHEAMATPALLVLLVGTVKAKERLDELQALVLA